jgi:transcription initiation factor IIE alpha subunit
MLAFYRRAQADGNVIVTQDKLASETKIEICDLRRVINQLKSRTLIEVMRTGHRGMASEYRLMPVERIDIALAAKRMSRR